ncbi:MAG: uroporphyrinogen-III C-methyltransferase [Brotaphodocola sp.]
MKVRIGTRTSRLAMVQTELVRDMILERFPEAEIDIVPIVTQGDKQLEKSLTSFGGKGVFTKELEEELLQGNIDMAIHCAKDMPMEFPDGLALGAVLERANASDVLVTLHGRPASHLPAGSIIGTSSLRRELQIRDQNPQAAIKMVRGNVQTRLRKLLEGQYDGLLLAAAGLERLKIVDPNEAEMVDAVAVTDGNAAKADEVCDTQLLKINYRENPEDEPKVLYLEYLDKKQFIPAAGQGILTIEIRQGELSELMQALHSPQAEAQLRAERDYLSILGGNCNAPCGAYCYEEGKKLKMDVMYAPDGKHTIYRSDVVALEGSEPEYLNRQAKELAKKLALQVSLKTVSLVGAGPGDGGLLTRKGLECVRKADVIVYDNLIYGSVLNEARLDAELIYAGKRSNNHFMTQSQINACLVEHALKGKYVVRLKGGDPFIFGRGGEEALELVKYGIPFEIVPGVSSCYSVPAYAGIPVTHRDLASSFHVITGHESSAKDGSVLDYATLAKEEGTLIFLMGLKNLEQIAANLMKHGKPADTPAAVIQQGTTSRQKRALSDLAHIVEEVKRRGIQTPAITVVGPVAGLAGSLDWFGRDVGKKKQALTDDMPLHGKRVLITGTRYFAQEMESELKPLGAEAVAVSLIESRPLWGEVQEKALEELERYQWLVFTSSNGVDLFFEAMRHAKKDLRSLMHIKFAAIGRKTAAALEAHGFSCDFVPSSFSGADLAAEWIPTLEKDTRVMLMRAKEGSAVLPRKLKEAGIKFADIPLYETWADERRREELNRIVKEVDYVTIASASAVKALCRMLDDKEGLSAKVVSIGPYTTKEADERGIKVQVEASEFTAAGIASAILADASGCGEEALYEIPETGMMQADEDMQEDRAVCTHKTDNDGTLKSVDMTRRSQKKHSGTDTGETAYFPMFFDMSGQKIVIAGAGVIATRRAETLAGFDADILVVAPDGTEGMEQLEKDGAVRWERRAFVESDLDDAYMVLAATSDRELNDAIAAMCHEKKILVNHAGDKNQCDFYFPGIARDGRIVIGATTSGKNHRLARQLTEGLRVWLEQMEGK